MKPLILAIDPGKATGICLVRRDPLEKLWSEEVDWWGCARLVDQTLREYGSDVDVVVERFTISMRTAKNSQAPWSLEQIGIIRFLTKVHIGEEITIQNVSDALKFSSNDRLRAIGLWHKGGAGHAKDALRHALLRLVNTGWSDPRLLQVDASH